MMRFSPRLSAGLPLPLLMLCVHADACAQAADAGQVAPARVEVVGSAAQYDARREDTSTKIVVTQEELRKYGDSTIADVLKRQPGITVSGGMGGRGGEIRMRGLGNGYTQILLNGEPAPDGFAVESLAPELVERIEILRAATAELGARAIAGTINIILKRKVQAAQCDLTLRAEHSNVFFSPGATLQLSHKGERMSAAMGVEVRNGRFEQDYSQVDEGWDSAGYPTLLRRNARGNDGSFRTLTLTPRVNWTLDNGDALNLQTLVRLQRSHGQTEGRWDTVLGSTPDYPDERSWRVNRDSGLRADLNWSHALGEGGKLEVTAGVDADRVRDFLHEAGLDAAQRPGLDREVRDDSDSRSGTLKGKVSMAHDGSHEVSLGWDAASRTFRAGSDELERLGLDASLLHTVRDDRAILRRLALYAQDEWTVTPRLSAYLGLRWETLRTRAEGGDFDPVHRSASVLSPIFQGVWKIPGSKQDQLQDQMRLALTRTYRDDDPKRLIPRVVRSLNNTAVTPDRAGNPGLTPEPAWGIDAALEHYGGKGEQLSLSMYARRIEDIVHDDTSLVQGRWLARPVNDGSASTRGIEFDGKLPLRALWAAGPDVDLRMNASRHWSRVSNVPGPDNRLAGQTPFSANAGFDVRYSAGVSGGMSFTWRSGGPQRISQTTSTYSSVKRELEMYGLWKLTPKTQLRVTGVNLLAEPATEVTRYEDAFGSRRSTSVYPFSAILRVSLETQF